MKRGKKAVCCPVETTLRIIEGRWKVMVLHYLLDGTKRFNELHRLLTGVSHRTLAQQLRELERDGVVNRKVHAQIPPKVEYSLTRLGASLEPILTAMEAWGEKYADRVREEA